MIDIIDYDKHFNIEELFELVFRKNILLNIKLQFIQW